jgi:hypothetical protein
MISFYRSIRTKLLSFCRCRDFFLTAIAEAQNGKNVQVDANRSCCSRFACFCPRICILDITGDSQLLGEVVCFLSCMNVDPSHRSVLMALVVAVVVVVVLVVMVMVAFRGFFLHMASLTRIIPLHSTASSPLPTCSPHF